MSDRPGDGDRIFDVDVFVDGDDHFADPIAVLRDTLPAIPRLLVVALLQTYSDIGPEIHQWFDEVNFLDRIETLLDKVALDQSRHAHRFDLRAFARRDLADDRDPDGILTVGGARELEDQTQSARIDVAHRLAVRSLLFHVLGRNDAFEHDLRSRRHFEIDGLTLDERHRRALKPACQGKLVDVRRNFLRRRIRYDVDGAAADGDLQRLAHTPGLLPLSGKILGRAGHETATCRALDQAAIVADVALACFRIFGHPMAGGDVWAVVEARGRDRNGKFIDPAMGEQFGPHVHFFLCRSAIDHHRRDQMIQRIDPAIRYFVRLAPESHGIIRFGAR